MIQIENLSRYYGDFLAVDNLNVTIQKGEIVGLLGPNGAGKSTTIRMLCAYLLPSEGDIKVEGLSVKQDPLLVKDKIGYLPESAPLYKDIMVFDYLHYVAEVRGLEKDAAVSRVTELADLCGIREVMHKNVNALSKGYRQRVGLAHAMMSDPDILVLDEPTSGLDPNQIIEIRDLIKRIGKEKTVILSSHILSEVEATCDRVVIINRGAVIADGETEKLRSESNQQQELLLEFKSADAGLYAKLSALSGVESAKEEGTALRLHGERGQDLRETVYQTIKASDAILLSMELKTKSLEDIFRKLTGNANKQESPVAEVQ